MASETTPPPAAAPALSFTFAPSLSTFNVPMKAYLSSHSDHDAIITGAVIFDSRDRLLLLQRASHDTMPDRWEVPGGSCDISDATILHSAAREVWEESGLRVCALSRCVGPPGVFLTRRGLSICKFTFDAQVECTDDVRLDPDEHSAYAWASEAECRSRRVEVAGSVVQIRFTSRAQEEVVVEAFRARRAGLTPQG
ncbi:MAG: hypothetical protein M1840_004995 [Geoglossum simile]|nr:MAG: hypothetical protein M1840_004995 [Geoglossum simile]